MRLILLTPIVIAHVVPTTGRFALHAEADRRGAEMAVEEFNARGGCPRP
jgi:ABC-type branched-subunit amino acid transport system substrate-binding protein